MIKIIRKGGFGWSGHDRSCPYGDVARLWSVLLFMVFVSCNSPAAAPHGGQGVNQTSDDHPERFGFGRAASAAEIEIWDIDIMSDGAGLPPGEGSVNDGKAIYQQKCMVCHGATGKEGPNDQLVGRLPGDVFTMHEDITTRRYKAVGSYWPYSTTLFDYIRRAMPQPAPGSLTDDEVYALTAYILYLNDLVGADAVMDAETLPAVDMPARDLFVPDDRLNYEQVH